MENINERFVQLRKTCKKNQTEFSKILGISRSGVADIETGRRKVTEKHLIMLRNWDEYNVNIDWLRTGEGEMFLETETEALERIRQEYHLTDRQFSLVANYLRLPEGEKAVISDYLESVFGDDHDETVQERIDREVAEYRADLEMEARQESQVCGLSGSETGGGNKEAI